MSEEIFRFKQFSIRQDRCAMKVGTDGILLGAWATCKQATSVLDIGTGTGILALMIAQRSEAIIDAIEIDKQSCEQATENIAGSRFKNRITPYCITFQDFLATRPPAYDLIICNPPFFTDSLKTPDHSRNLARHNDQLPFSIILEGAKFLLKPDGILSMILPFDDASSIISQAKSMGLFCNRKLSVRPKSNKSFHRALVEFSPSALPLEEKSLIIEMGKRHQYTDDFKELTNDFYLYFQY
jgi:tRNA1Val (adenine37-N6)-methyltransferase